MKIDEKKFWNGDVMPVGGFYGPIGSYTDKDTGETTENFLQDKYFQMIADAGVNLITCTDCNYDTEPEDMIKTLELCEKYGIRLFVRDTGLKADMTKEEMDTRISAYSGYKSFGGIRVVDEPTVSYFPNKKKNDRPLSDYSELACRINEYEDLMGYVNLWPYYPWNECTEEDYTNYVREYCESCDAKMVSADHYIFCYLSPFVKEESYDEYKNGRGYFRNLSILREEAKRFNIPFWNYIQCGGQWNFEKRPRASIEYHPLEGEFLWNVNTSLAMGAKGIDYFPLVEPYFYAVSDEGLDENRNGMIGVYGNKTQWYDYVEKANQQIFAVDEVLMNSEHQGVLAVEKAVDDMTDVVCYIEGKTFRELKDIKLEEVTGTKVRPDGALIGCFDYQGKTALYVVNYDMYGAQKIILELVDEYKVTMISDKGTETLSTNEVAIKLYKGEAVLLVIE